MFIRPQAYGGITVDSTKLPYYKIEVPEPLPFKFKPIPRKYEPNSKPHKKIIVFSAIVFSVILMGLILSIIDSRNNLLLKLILLGVTWFFWVKIVRYFEAKEKEVDAEVKSSSDYIARIRNEVAEEKSEYHKKNKEVEESLKENEYQANMLLIDVNDILDTDIPRSLKEASTYISQAEITYQKNLYSQYWDNLDDAILKIELAKKQFNAVESKSKKYQAILRGQKHNFPPLFQQRDFKLNPIAVFKEYCRIKELGESNYQFAKIEEMRKTRKVIAAGFGSFNHMLNAQMNSINSSFNYFRDSVDQQFHEFKKESKKSNQDLEQALKEQKEYFEEVIADLKQTFQTGNH